MRAATERASACAKGVSPVLAQARARRPWHAGLVTAVLVLGLATPTPAADALAVLRANCHRCHGQDGSREGGFGNVLDVPALRERTLIVPGNAGQSKLFRRVAKGQMPPADETPRPSPADVE